MIVKLLRVELLKIRRSLALLMMLASPLVVVALVLGMTLKNTPVAEFTPATSVMASVSITALWSYFMLPLYVALATSLVNGNEHRNQTWRLMLTLPVSQHELYLAKALTAWLLIAGANLALVAFTVVAIGSIGALGYPIDGVLSGQMAVGLLKILIACLPMLVVQHAVSWRYSNIVLPLAIGVIATMGIIQIGSSEYWVYYPWSYVLMAVNGTDAQMQQRALLLAAGLGVLLYAISAAWLGRREVA